MNARKLPLGLSLPLPHRLPDTMSWARHFSPPKHRVSPLPVPKARGLPVHVLELSLPLKLSNILLLSPPCHPFSFSFSTRLVTNEREKTAAQCATQRDSLAPPVGSVPQKISTTTTVSHNGQPTGVLIQRSDCSIDLLLIHCHRLPIQLL